MSHSPNALGPSSSSDNPHLEVANVYNQYVSRPAILLLTFMRVDSVMRLASRAFSPPEHKDKYLLAFFALQNMKLYPEKMGHSVGRTSPFKLQIKPSPQ